MAGKKHSAVSSVKILCPKCKQVRPRTRHHILPKRHFNNSPTIDLCAECHRQLEQLIPFYPVETPFYFRVVRDFLKA